jgi:ABC-2 type transport system ATP-binding protein
MNTAIETKNLTKSYGKVLAVSELSLSVNSGEIYAFLGLNGAGKTTTIRMLLGMIKPSAGNVQVLGTKINGKGKKPWNSVGYLVETPNAYPELTVRENLEVIRKLRPGTDFQAVDKIIDQLGLAPYANRRAGTLSHGNAQRLGLAKALMHRPKLLILDEPASGLDPAGIVEIRNLLTNLAVGQGVTIFMSSHILGEVSRLAHRIGIIHRGELIQELSKEELHQNRNRQLLIRTRDCEAAQLFLNKDGFSVQIDSNGCIVIKDRGAIENPEEIAIRLVNDGHAPTMLKVEEEDLEDYFMRLVGNPDRNSK